MNTSRTAGNPFASTRFDGLRPDRPRRQGNPLVSGLAGLVLLLGGSSCGRDTGREIKIGVLVLQGSGTPSRGAARPGTAPEGANGPTRDASASPPAGAADPFGMRGLALALDELNADAKGGKPVRLVTASSDGDSHTAVAAFRKLVETERVPVVIAALTSNEVLACAPFANQSKTVLLATMATSSDVRTAGDYVFRNVADTKASAEALARAVAERFPRAKAVIVHPSLEFGLSLRDELQAALAAQNSPLAETIPYTSRGDDTEATLDRVAQASSPVVYLLGSGGEVVAMLKRARERGLKAQFALGGDLSADLLASAGPAAEGAIAAVEGFDPAGTAPRTRELVTAYRARYGTTPSGFNAAAYDAVKMVGSLLRQGAANGEALRTALYGAAGYQGAGGAAVTFDADGETGLPPRLVVVREGKLQPLR